MEGQEKIFSTVIMKLLSTSLTRVDLKSSLTWCSASGNFIIIAKHIPGMNNDIADALSQFQASRFRQLAPGVALKPCQCPCTRM